MSSQTGPSWCRTTLGDTAEATFRWTIEKLKDRPEMSCKEFVRSIMFKMKGPGDLKTKWQLLLYPKGRKRKDYIELMVGNHSPFKVKAEYKISIIDGAGKERETHKSRNVKEFDSADSGPNCWGTNKWLEREKFNDYPELLPEGNLTVQCKITVFGPEKVLSGSDFSSGNSDLLVNSLKQVSQHLGTIFFEKQFADIKIDCGGQSFDCHKAILAARSPVFLAMFQSNMKENETNTVAIEDFKEEVVSEMLAFIYTGNISSHDTTKEIADKYQLDHLKNLCEDRLCSTMEKANCVEYLVLGDMYQTLKMKRMALRLVVENVDSITESDVIKNLFKQKPELALEVMKAVKK